MPTVAAQLVHESGRHAIFSLAILAELIENQQSALFATCLLRDDAIDKLLADRFVHCDSVRLQAAPKLLILMSKSRRDEDDTLIDVPPVAFQQLATQRGLPTVFLPANDSDVRPLIDDPRRSQRPFRCLLRRQGRRPRQLLVVARLLRCDFHRFVVRLSLL